MRLDTANRSFWAIVALAATPFLVLGALGCGVLSLTAYRIATGGPSVLGDGPAAAVATVFLVASVLGAALVVRSLARQARATAVLTRRLRGHQITAPARLRAIASDAGIDQVRLVDDSDAYSLTVGLLDPVVHISTGLVDRSSDTELAAVLAHERYHVVNHDPLKIAFARALTAGLFLLPAARHLLDRYLVGRELGADRRALRRCGRPALAGALLQSAGGPVLPQPGAAAAFGGDHLLEVRITQLEADSEPDLPSLSGTALASTVAGMVAMTVGLVATVIAADVPTVLDSPSGGLDLAGAAMCVAMWIFVGLAVRNRHRRPAGGLTRTNPLRTTGA